MVHDTRIGGVKVQFRLDVAHSVAWHFFLLAALGGRSCFLDFVGRSANNALLALVWKQKIVRWRELRVFFGYSRCFLVDYRHRLAA